MLLAQLISERYLVAPLVPDLLLFAQIVFKLLECCFAVQIESSRHIMTELIRSMEIICITLQAILFY